MHDHDHDHEHDGHDHSHDHDHIHEHVFDGDDNEFGYVSILDFYTIIYYLNSFLTKNLVRF